MKKTLVITAIAALLIGVFSLSAWAFGGPGCGNPDQNGNPRFQNRLNLTFEQQQKLMQIRQDFAKDTLNLRFDLQKKNLELRQLKAANPVNQGAVNSKTKEIDNLRLQLQNKQNDMLEKMKAVLTPDQQKQIENMKLNHNFGFRGKGKRGGCCGGGF